ncbi:MAG: carboxymuconolactone decarboxylase family protein [marine benthic group bacterium]|nr:carboxymuconolactone decarboxylase family protein [Gemmatimonadota bacterium]MCL7958485.1 carboxymuconolactone decarboxylase family protein [Gemmatimonadota bacterium]MCL7968790.1 carboxymuconolactone decarboxylase family protein [Gemmatimonadota bacterium]MCL7973929.1 carboxymuconolactone decarboxylase family protein [Gemmatimonadota bacterium]MCL7976568.1 carboxymuconolactone decarboxylase family protein [Gemmatimonadota bacterium]
MSGEAPLHLEPGLELLIEVSACLAARDVRCLDSALTRAVETCKPVEVEEVLLQSHLFLGYPAALTALARWRSIASMPAADLDDLRSPERVDAWTHRGERVCERVYGRAYEKLRSNVARIHPAMDRWMVTEGYGKVLGRPGLDLRARELCIVAMLAVGGWEPQLHSHLRGALHAGARPEAVEAALETGLRFAGKETIPSARALWRRVAHAHGSEAPGVR